MNIKQLLLVAAVLVGSAAASATGEEAGQASGLTAVHRQGQTFLTWKEVNPPLVDERISFPKFGELVRKLASQSPRVRYRLYRASEPIRSVEKLTPVGETGQLSCWNDFFEGGGSPGESDLVKRYIIEEGKPPLAAATGLYVHNPRALAADAKTLRGYYAVTAVVDGRENQSIGPGNTLAAAVEETQGQGMPVLQSSREVKEFNFVAGPTLSHYIRWEAPPHANRENLPMDLVVAIPKDLARPAPVGLHLHCWGGSPWGGYGWWFNAEKGAILIAANQVPYDWWTGYHEKFGLGERDEASWKTGVVRPYTQRRLLSLVDWAATQWDIDRSRVFTAGSSMGGSGAPMLAIRNPDRIAWAIGWVGVHVPSQSPQFKGSYAQVYGEPEWESKFEDGTPAWDYFNDAWYLRKYVARETPFITWSNGKNDGAIGWSQAVEFLAAMQDTRRPHMFVWGQSGHGQRAIMPLTHDERIMPLDIRTDRSLPAFTRCSLDNNPGDGNPADGDAAGGVNLYLYWDTQDIVDTPSAWEMTVGLCDKAREEACTTDVTPRRLQHFKVVPSEKLRWVNLSGGKEIQSGEATADEHGLVTLKGVKVTKAKNRIRLER